METLVIAFGFKAESGKDECCKTIIRERSGKPYNVRRYGFGDAVKFEVNEAAENKFYETSKTPQEAMQELCQWAGVTYDPNPPMDDPLCPYGKQRDLLQWWGTEYRRAQDKDYWVKKLQARLEEDKPQVALISDLRFLNEFAWFIDPMGCAGRVVRVDRLGFVSKRMNSTQKNHQSEVELSFIPDKDWHYIIQVPDNHLEELQKDALAVYDHVIESLNPPNLEDVEKELEAHIRANFATPNGTQVLN